MPWQKYFVLLLPFFLCVAVYHPSLFISWRRSPTPVSVRNSDEDHYIFNIWQLLFFPSHFIDELFLLHPIIWSPHLPLCHVFHCDKSRPQVSRQWFVPFVSCCGNYWYGALLQAWPLLKLQDGFYLALFLHSSFCFNWIFLAFCEVGAELFILPIFFSYFRRVAFSFISTTHVCARVTSDSRRECMNNMRVKIKIPRADA